MLACWNKESKNRPDFLLLEECIRHIRQGILDEKQKEALSKSVPAQNTVYYNSKDLYLNMNDYILNKDNLEQAFDIKNEYLDMNIVRQKP